MTPIEEARASGYTEDEIQAHLAPKVAEAQAQGYSPEDIGKFIGVKPIDHAAANTALAARVQKEITKGQEGGNRQTALQQMGQTVKDAATVYAPIEGALNLATGVIGFGSYLAGGVGGLIARHTYSPETDPKEIASKFAEAMTYQPHTDAGIRFTSALTYPLRTLMGWSESGAKKVADTTRSPTAAAITEATIQMLPAFLVPALGRAVHGKTPTNSDMYAAAKDVTDAVLLDWDKPLSEQSDSVKAALGKDTAELPYTAGALYGHLMDREGGQAGASAYLRSIGVTGIRYTSELADKIQAAYEKTGVDPQTLKTEALQNPVVMADLVSSNKTPFTEPVVPATNQQVRSAAEEIKAKHGLDEFAAWVDGGDIYLANIEAGKQGAGKGTAAMKDLTDFADAHGMAVKLIPEVRENTSAERLTGFYSRFGFESTPEGMRRLPGAGGSGGGAGAPPPGTLPRAAAAPPPPPPGSPAAAQAAVLARVSTDAPGRRLPTLGELYTAVKDDLYPIAKIEKSLNNGKMLDKAESPYALARLIRGASGKATQFLDYGTFDWASYRNTGPGLKDILAPHAKDLDGMRAYMVARRAEELHARGIETGLPLAEAAQVVAAGGKYAQAFDQLQAYQNSLVKYLKDSGLIGDEAYAALLDANKDYVPFHRVFAEDKATGSPGAGMRSRNPIRNIKGSERIIVDPVESIIKNTYLYTALAERNAVGRAFGDLVAKDRPAAEAMGVKVVPSTQIKPITLEASEIRKLFDEFVTSSRKTSTQRSESSKSTTTGAGGSAAAEPTNKIYTMNKSRVKDALEARGFSDGEAEIMMNRLRLGTEAKATAGSTETVVERMVKEVTTTEFVTELNIRLPNDAATIFRRNTLRPEPNQIRYFESGKPVTLEVPEGVADAFNAADGQSAGMLLKVLAFPAKTLRAGAILTPDFALRNVFRDQSSAFSFSKSGYIPVFDMVRGALSIAKKDGDFQDWLKSGGANSAMVSLDREYLQQHLVTLDKDADLLRRSWNVVSSPIEVLRITSELMENATRLGEFKRNAHGTKAEIQAAGFESREVTLDFQRIGAQTRGLNMIAAFMNAGVEGLDRTVRAFKDKPIDTTARVAAGITLPSVLLWYANNSTPERQQRWRDIPNWERDLFWIGMTDEHTYRFPKPFELGVIFGSLPERMLDQFAADKPQAMSGFLKSVGQMASVNVMPTGAVPLLEQTTNHSFFTNNPLIPSRLEGILPEYQYNEYTSELSRAVGRAVGAFPGLRANSTASPIVIDNYIRGWTGGLGVYVSQALDAGLRKAGVLPDPPTPIATLADIPVVKAFVVRYPAATAQSIQDFYEAYGAHKQVFDTFQHLVKDGDPVAAKKVAELDPMTFVRLDGIQQSIGTLNTNIRMVYRNPEMTPSDKRQLIDAMYGQMIEMARAGNEAMAAVDATLNR